MILIKTLTLKDLLHNVKIELHVCVMNDSHVKYLLGPVQGPSRVASHCPHF